MKLSPEERKERKRESNKRYLQNRTEEQKEERKVKRKEYYERNRGDRPRRIRIPNLTEEERKEKKREDNKRYSQNMTKELSLLLLLSSPLLGQETDLLFSLTTTSGL